MRDMQTKILDAINKVVSDIDGVEVVDKRQWANTGELYFQPVDGFGLLLRLRYSFQDRGSTIGLSHHALAHAPEPTLKGQRPGWYKGNNANGALDGPTVHFDYTDTERIEVMLDLVRATLRSPVESDYRAGFEMVVKSVDDIPDAERGGIDGVDPAADNYVRATLAGAALKAYMAATGSDLDTAVSDLLGDLRHLCDALDLDFDQQSEHGARHYTAELKGEL